MRQTLSLIYIILLGFIANRSFSQNGKDTLLLLDGNTIITTIVDTTNGIISYKNINNPKKNKRIEKDDIFSINDSNNCQTLIYAYDTTNGNDYTVEEMTYFIRGEQDASKFFKVSPVNFWSNLLLSAGAGLTGSFWSPIMPLAFSGITVITKVKIKEGTVSRPEDLNHPPYIKGYEHETRKKRKIKSLIGGGIGLVVGLGTSFILFNGANNAVFTSK